MAAVDEVQPVVIPISRAPHRDMVERDILAHIAQGETNRDIARALNLSERTVRRRVIQVYGKLQVNDRVDAALYAERHGLRVAGGADES